MTRRPFFFSSEPTSYTQFNFLVEAKAVHEQDRLALARRDRQFQQRRCEELGIAYSCFWEGSRGTKASRVACIATAGWAQAAILFSNPPRTFCGSSRIGFQAFPWWP